MKPKSIALIAVALGCGLVAMLCVQQVIQGSKGAAKVPTRKVLVVLKDVKPGTVLKETDVQFEERPETSLRKDAITKVEQYQARAAKVALVTGDVINESKLLPKGIGGKSIEIPVGFRVITITTSNTQSHSGMLQPGDRVDIQVTFKGKGGTKTLTLMEFVEVFATENRTQTTSKEKQDNKINSISLLVLSEQVNYVRLAEQRGKLSFVWRNPQDDEITNNKAVNSAILAELTHSLTGDVPTYDLDQEEPTADVVPQPVAEPVATQVEPTPPAEPVTPPQVASAPPVQEPIQEPVQEPVQAPLPDPVPADPTALANSVQSFLNTPAPAPTPVVATKPKGKIWTVQIRTGRNVVAQEFEQPVKEPSAVTSMLNKFLPSSKK